VKGEKIVFDIYTLVEAIWLVIPIYAANGLAPLFKGKHRMDGGRLLRGKPIFGSGKSWEGFIGGIVVGGVIGLVEQLAFPYLPFGSSPVMLTLVPMSFFLGLLLGFGALFGDLGGAFVKRRCGIERGRPAPLLDQEDFIIGAFFFASFAVALRADWFVLLFIITPAIHLFANIIGFALKVKKEPW